ncbi:hypothetical protein Tco_0050396, partial [Tanacetum coccineum]
GMSIDPKLLVLNFPVIMGSLGFLIIGKTILVAGVGRLFAVSSMPAMQSELVLCFRLVEILLLWHYLPKSERPNFSKPRFAS